MNKFFRNTLAFIAISLTGLSFAPTAMAQTTDPVFDLQQTFEIDVETLAATVQQGNVITGTGNLTANVDAFDTVVIDANFVGDACDGLDCGDGDRSDFSVVGTTGFNNSITGMVESIDGVLRVETIQANIRTLAIDIRGSGINSAPTP